MTSTLADLQRRNLEKMEAKETPDAEVSVPSNEVPIIPSNEPSLEASKETLLHQPNDGMMGNRDEVSIIPSSHPSKIPRKERAIKAVEAPLNASAKENTGLRENTGLKEALETQIRERLMAQLLAGEGKGPVTRLNVEMPEDLHMQLKQHSVKTRRPIKALINALIELYLDQEDAL